MTILNELKKRNILKDITNKTKFNNLKKGDGVYIGFDPTSDSLHLGNYIQITILKRFANYGFKPIAIIGGATGMIGDPSGKNKEREIIKKDQLLFNKNKIKKQIEKFGINVIDNYKFYEKYNFLEFIRDIGKSININYMINKEVVASRLQTGITFTEFSYQLIQGYDFLHLYKNYNVKIQVGGSDQWGNITTGIEIIHKKLGENNNALGITSNLLTSKQGKKFGKSEGNVIWLDKNKTSPYVLYQHLLNTDDQDLEKFFKWITFISISEIEKIIENHNCDPKKRKGQKKLSFEIVKDIHSEKEANQAQKISQILFSNICVSNLSEKDCQMLENAIPTINSKTKNIQDLLIESNVASSKRQARNFIETQSIEINGQKIKDINYIHNPTLFNKKYSIIKKGKKKFFLIKHN